MFFPRLSIRLALAALLAIVTPVPAPAYSLLSYRWPAGSNISMNLQLSRSVLNGFQDGSASWNASAADAFGIWNQYITSVKFVSADSPAANGAQPNVVSFSTAVGGYSFGSGVLAVTLNYSSSGSGIFTKTEVIFNGAYQWNSYRGPLQHSGSTYVYDFHRVAIHEFGHVLGLDHPDEHGQSVDAVMNSIISDLDHIADDDIAGARNLYGLLITSPATAQAQSGDSFSYQVTAQNSPSSYSAMGLPPGLQINSATGLITGRPMTSGTFPVDVVVQGGLGIAVGRIQIFVAALPITSAYTPPSVLIGDSFSYRITALNSPTSFSATGLPTGFSIDPLTGVISGSSLVARSYSVLVKATSATSEAAGTVTIRISGPEITSLSSPPPQVDIGSSFLYQITANNRPTSFSATGLPPGLRCDSTTGQITGTPTLSGNFGVFVSAHGAFGDATGFISIWINSLPDGNPPLAKIPIDNDAVVLADPVRERIYLGQDRKLVVLDAQSFAVVATIPGVGSSVSGLSMSADGKRLWVATAGTRASIQAVDLETLTLLPKIDVTYLPRYICEAANGRLYIASRYSGGVSEIDPISGANLGDFNPSLSGFPTCGIEISPDRKTLYVSGNGTPAVLAKYDVSTASGPVLQQRIETANSYGGDLELSPDGQTLLHTVFPNSPPFATTSFRSASDLALQGELSPATGDDRAVFSRDGSLIFRRGASDNKIDVYQSASHTFLRTIVLSGNIQTPFPMGVDASNSNLFVTALTSYYQRAVYVYPVGPSQSLPPPPHSLLNVATRLRSQNEANVLIGGFILTGTEPKKVILRASGPSLPVSGRIFDPVLELHGSDGNLVAENDNWNAHRAEVLATSLPPANERESAIVATLPPGAYTGIVRGVGETTGVALIELYDLTPGSNSRIANISTRGKVETGDNVMIGGFIIGGDQPTKVIVRAVGPSLAQRGVAGALADTTLDLYDGNGTRFASNDDWRSEQEAEINASTVPPTDPRESAIVRTLQPGNYTAIVRGKNDTTGVALVEVYNLETN